MRAFGLAVAISSLVSTVAWADAHCQTLENPAARARCQNEELAAAEARAVIACEKAIPAGSRQRARLSDLCRRRAFYEARGLPIPIYLFDPPPQYPPPRSAYDALTTVQPIQPETPPGYRVFFDP